MNYFAEDLITSIKKRGLVPQSEGTFQTDGFLNLATEEMNNFIAPKILEEREDYFNSPFDVNIVAGVSYYRIPERSISETLKVVFYVLPGQSPQKLDRIDVEDSVNYAGDIPTAFYFMGDEIVLCPTPSRSEGVIRFIYPKSPSKMIQTISCGKITSITDNGATVTFGVDTDLTSMYSVSSLMDFVSSKGPFKNWAIDQAIVQITSNSIEFNKTDLLSEGGAIEPKIGDYICPAGYSNIPQLPVSFQACLAHSVCVRLLESLGDINKLGAAIKSRDELLNQGLSSIRNRVENSPKKISGRNSLISRI